MDERIEKEEINYTPEMAGWGDDESIKEKNKMEWLKGRAKVNLKVEGEVKAKMSSNFEQPFKENLDSRPEN